jgi:hypothetical protein
MSVVVWRDSGRETMVKGNNGIRWISDGVLLWLGKRQNGDAVEWWGEWPNLRWSFYSSGGWESGDPERVAYDGGADSLLQFWLESECDGTKHWQKIKRRQWAHLDSMRRKRDTARRCDDIGRRRCGTGEGKGRRWHQLGWHKSYCPKKWRKSTWSILLVQMNGEDLKHQWVKFFK